MKSKTVVEQNGTTKNIDGFFRGRSTVVTPRRKPSSNDAITVLAAPSPAPKPRPAAPRGINHAAAHVPQPAKTSPVRTPIAAPLSKKPQKIRVVGANHAKAHTPQHSQTLMRTAVKRPDPSLRKQANTRGELQHKVPSLIATKQSAYSVEPSRLARAQAVHRSPQIARHTSAAASLKPQFVALSVKPVPEKPEAEVPSNPPAPHPTNKPIDIWEHALANASNFVDVQAHRAHFRKLARSHLASMAAGALALVVVGGYAAYLNTPGLQVKVASFQAGFTTQIPSYKATGFAYNGVHATDGKLTVGLTKAGHNYQLTQQATNLSGSDVIQNLGATDTSGAPDYTTVQAGSTTVYRFGNSMATWVNNGKQYTITGNSTLSTDQLQTLVQNS